MIIGDRLRAVREEKKLSQADIEKRVGLLRGYISRVENGHAVPAVETLEELARALEIPLYQLFYDREEPPRLEHLPYRKTSADMAWGISGKGDTFFAQIESGPSASRGGDRKLLMALAQQITRSKKRPR